MNDIQKFFAKYDGKYIDFDGFYGNQCMDLYRQFVKEVLKLPQSPGVIGAADVWDTYLKEHNDKIENTLDALPQEGDIIIWKRASSLPYGHIAICAKAGQLSFTSFDQNYPTGSPCHFQNHRYVNVLGWLRAKGVNEVITDSTKIPQIEDKEVQAIRSELYDLRRDKITLEGKLFEYEKELDLCYQKLSSLSDEIIILREKVIKLEKENSVVTFPASEYELTPVEKSFVANLIEKIRKFFGF